MLSTLTLASLTLAVGVHAAPHKVPQTNNAAVKTPTNNAVAGALNFGSCSDPSVIFGAGLDGRKATEFSFLPNNLQEFNHNSALNPDIIYQFQCDTLVNKCGFKREDAIFSTCQQARTTAAALGPKGASADKFNELLGFPTNFAALDNAGAAAGGNGNGNQANTAPAAPVVATPVAAGTLDFGSCTDPSVIFGAGLDGRKATEFSFLPNNLQEFSHGSALNPDIIYQFQCDTLVNKCGFKQQDTIFQVCQSARTQASALGKVGASADLFNSLLGFSTNFAALDNSGAGAGNAGNNTGNAGNNTGNNGGNTGNNGADNTGADTGAGNAGNNTGTDTGNNDNTGNNGNNNAGAGQDISNLSAEELQTVLQLSPDLVQPASARNGQEENPTDGQVESLTSVNNFINYCATKPNLALTNGEQNFAGSCNGIIMGEIMAKDKMPSAKVLFPPNNAVIEEGTDINFQIKVRSIQTGSFTNAQRTYYSAPQQLNAQGIMIGHQHVTVNEEPSADATEPLDPQDFVFFKGLNDPAVNDVLSAVATGGLKAGFYRACTLGSSANHTPIIPPIAQRASGEDCVRFQVVPAGQAGNANAGNANAGNANAGNANAGNANANAGNQGKGKGRNQGRSISFDLSRK
ncbi:hypothetical protein EXIGLDRAFT_762621 [Exidia glandulosa HHB12029]|uniref:Uncharacterized protein n=1 Tax=Exidia glandulosa HHB12029 TaxID=1314781 RepID=A0A165MNK5_EXIGL|nr:hypothetical protein EXIGLDRAFT_762621 [Exidia glandulosa HHB12029]